MSVWIIFTHPLDNDMKPPSVDTFEDSIEEKSYGKCTLEELEEIKLRINKEIKIKEELSYDSMIVEDQKISIDQKISTNIKEETISYSDIKQESSEIECIANDKFSAEEERALEIIQSLEFDYKSDKKIIEGE